MVHISAVCLQRLSWPCASTAQHAGALTNAKDADWGVTCLRVPRLELSPLFRGQSSLRKPTREKALPAFRFKALSPAKGGRNRIESLCLDFLPTAQGGVNYGALGTGLSPARRGGGACLQDRAPKNAQNKSYIEIVLLHFFYLLLYYIL